MTPIFPLPDSLRTVLDTINRVYHTILMLPPQASTLARQIDTLHYFQITIYMAMCVVYYAFAVFFLIRYRIRPGRDHGPLIQAPLLVGGYAAGVFTLFVAFWLAGHLEYREIRTPPARTLDVYVAANQWVWKFAYTDGGSSIGVLYVPVGQPVRLLLTSRDVIHSFFVPAFRLKQDAVPGTYTTLWFEATTPGIYPVFCTQMCGTGHAQMRGAVAALGRDDYDRWREGGGPVLPPSVMGAGAEALGTVAREPLANADQPGGGLAANEPVVSIADLGRRAAATYGCLKCHTTDGQPHIGPTWLGLYGNPVRLQNGSAVIADEAYLTESMMDPAARVVAGFAPIMPSYQGILAPADVAALLEYIKSLRDPRQPHVVAPLPAGATPPAPAQNGNSAQQPSSGRRP